jgi:hypothetical protein
MVTVLEQHEVEMLADAIGHRKIIGYAALRVICTDCKRQPTVLAAMWWQGRPLVATLERGDRLDHAKTLPRFWDYHWLDVGPVAHARCDHERYLFDARTLSDEMPLAGRKRRVIGVAHGQHGGILR